MLAEQGGGWAGEFGRLFLSPLRHFSLAVGRRSYLAGFRPVFSLFSVPGHCILFGREVVSLSGWPASSVAAGTLLTGISPENFFFYFLGFSP